MQKVIVVALVAVASAAVADRAPPPAANGAPAMDKEMQDPGLMPARKIIPPAPHSAPEIAALGKLLAGHWKCTGNSSVPDGKKLAATGTLDVETALDGGWVRSRITMNVRAGVVLHSVSYRSFDPIAKLWTRVTLTSTGEASTDTSLGPVDPHGAWTWNDSASRIRTHEQNTKDAITLWAESPQGDHVYDAACSH